MQRSNRSARNLTERSAEEIGVRIRELRVVEQVESLRPEFGFQTLGNSRGLGQGQIEIRTSRTAEEVTRQAIASPWSIGNRGEGAAVEVQIPRIDGTCVGVVATASMPGVQD